MSKTLRAGKPAITLTTADFAFLSKAAGAAEALMPDLADEIWNEVERATVLPAGRTSDHVAIGSSVTYRDDATGKVQTITLVEPDQADISCGRVSIMTPIGVALIGLAAGSSMDWSTRNGGRKRLTVLTVEKSDRALPA